MRPSDPRARSAFDDERGALVRRPQAPVLRLAPGAPDPGPRAPAFIFVAILIARFATAEKQRIEGDAQVLARTLALTVAQRISGRIATLQALATSPNLRNDDLAEFYRQMKALQEQQGQNFGLREPRGDVLLSTRVPYGEPIPRTEGAVRAADEAALETRAPYVSDVYLGPVSRMPNITISVPVLQHDPPRMIVGASLDVSSLNDLLQPLGRPPSGRSA